MGNTHGTIHNELTHHLCENMLCFFVQLSMVISLTVGKSHGHYSIALYVETKMMRIFSSFAGCCAGELSTFDGFCMLSFFTGYLNVKLIRREIASCLRFIGHYSRYQPKKRVNWLRSEKNEHWIYLFYYLNSKNCLKLQQKTLYFWIWIRLVWTFLWNALSKTNGWQCSLTVQCPILYDNFNQLSAVRIFMVEKRRFDRSIHNICNK